METPTKTVPPVALDRLVRLLARFRCFAAARRKTAEGWRDKGQPRIAMQSDAVADHYERCANELERVINGETPADPGCDWPICETNVKSPPTGDPGGPNSKKNDPAR